MSSPRTAPVPSPEGIPVIAGKTAKDSWIPKVRDISFALKGEGQPFPWAIEGLIVEASANVVSGLPHTMKSFNMLAGCIELAHKGTLWGKFPAPKLRGLFISRLKMASRCWNPGYEDFSGGSGSKTRQTFKTFTMRVLGLLTL